MMLMSALLVSAVAVASDGADMSPELTEFSKETTEWVLSGQDLPRDYRSRLMRMPPSERLQALVLLRRSGLLEDDTWSLEDVLREAETGEQYKP